MKSKFSLFTTAFLQVFLVAANTYFISHLVWIGIAVAGFFISYIWTINVRKVNFGGKMDSFIYSLGAMFGGLAGVFIAQLF